MTHESKPPPCRLEETRRALSECVAEALEKYFQDLDGHEASNLYALIMAEVERPLFALLLARYDGNITRAARALGLNRSTVRARLKKYGLDTH